VEKCGRKVTGRLTGGPFDRRVFVYDFAILALLALATVKLVDFVSDNVDALRRFRTLLTYVAAIGGVWLLDYSVFTAWGTDIRDADLGVWMTGFIVAGLTVAWRAVFGYLTHDRATSDETLGDHRHVRAA
jgi:hypothetical protein